MAKFRANKLPLKWQALAGKLAPLKKVINAVGYFVDKIAQYF